MRREGWPAFSPAPFGASAREEDAAIRSNLLGQMAHVIGPAAMFSFGLLAESKNVGKLGGPVNKLALTGDRSAQS
jgi:hypothetical protein